MISTSTAEFRLYVVIIILINWESLKLKGAGEIN